MASEAQNLHLTHAAGLQYSTTLSDGTSSEGSEHEDSSESEEEEEVTPSLRSVAFGSAQTEIARIIGRALQGEIIHPAFQTCSVH